MSDPGRTHMIPVTIASGAQLSGAAPCQGYILAAIEMPTTFTGTAMTFQGDADGDDTFQDIYDNAGNQVSWTVAASRFIVPTAGSALITGATSIKVKSGSAEGGARIVKLHFIKANQ